MRPPEIDPIPCMDIGANLTHESFNHDRGEVLARARAAGVDVIVLTGASRTGSRKARTLAHTDPQLFSTAGIHPHLAADWNDELQAEIRTLLDDEQVVAAGECGLDFYRNISPQEDQERCFEAQLSMASEVQKPVFLHERDAHERFVEILEPWLPKLPRVVVHCFTGSEAALERYLELDCYIGITGWICDERRGTHLRELVDRIPANRLMVETDAPYLTPRDLKPRVRRNEPRNLPHILRLVAKCRGESPEELSESTRQTTREFFGL